jgi:hypothetical protein
MHILKNLWQVLAYLCTEVLPGAYIVLPPGRYWQFKRFLFPSFVECKLVYDGVAGGQTRSGKRRESREYRIASRATNGGECGKGDTRYCLEDIDSGNIFSRHATSALLS